MNIFENSILRNPHLLVVDSDPFPHVVIKDALSEDHAALLTAEFPISAFDLEKNNYRQDISASNLNKYPEISQSWKDFINFHCSKDFFLQLAHLFKEYIPYENLKQKNIDQFNTGIRFSDSPSANDIMLDAQISINTPVTHKGSVRKIHVDNTNKLFSGLFYLRQSADDSKGGNLQLFSWKQDYSRKKKLRLYQEGVQKKYCNLEKEIKYENNICILFINSLDALHSVTPRDKTQHVRTFVNIVGELPYELFKKHSFFERQFFELKLFFLKIKSSLKRFFG